MPKILSQPPKTNASLMLEDLDESRDLSGYDLNQLVVLMALLRRRNITHAGQSVRLSQPAASRALTRLRAIYGDELLVKKNNGFERTPLADSLLSKLALVLGDIDDILERRALPPERFTLAMPDHQALLLSGHMTRYFKQASPKTLFLPSTRLSNLLPRLERGEVDLVLGKVEDTPPGYFCRALPPSRLQGLCRAEHSVASQRLTHAELARYPSVIIRTTAQAGYGDIRDGLEQIHPDNGDRLAVNDIHTAARLILGTNALLVLPARSAVYLAKRYGLATFQLHGDSVPNYQLSLLWHERHHRDTIHSAVRSHMASLMLEES